MGSPVSVSVANLVMEDVEERALASFDIQLPFWKRYVDDTCTVVLKDRVQDLLQHLNGIEESINFIVEVENEGCIPFLDVVISRKPDGSISTSVYMKATHTDKYLDFDSHHPLSHKRSVVNTFQSRAKSHCASSVTTTDEMKHLPGSTVKWISKETSTGSPGSIKIWIQQPH